MSLEVVVFLAFTKVYHEVANIKDSLLDVKYWGRGY